MMISFPMILLRLSLALVLGALVGFEREINEHAAGMRTNALVALGSSLFMVISIYGFLDLLGISHVQVDPSRIASYVVAGIGFLGAGTIFLSQDKEKVKGLTTAATIWMVAAIGLACGAGMLLVATASTVFTLIVLILLRYMERLLLPRHLFSKHTLRIEMSTVSGPIIGQVYDICKRTGVIVNSLDVSNEQGAETLKVICRVPDTTALAHVIGELRGLPEIRAISADLNKTQPIETT